MPPDRAYDPADVLVALPLKAFRAAKGRLDGILSPAARAALSRAVAERVAAACTTAGAMVAVVASEPEVASWAGARGLEVIAEPPGGGLNGAALAAVAAARRQGRAWCVVHADLPFLTPGDVATVLSEMAPGRAVLAPSRNGGTNLLAAAVPLGFVYGPRSFSRHLAAARALERRVVLTLGTALDLDTPDDLWGAAALPGGEYLREYLT